MQMSLKQRCEICKKKLTLVDQLVSCTCKKHLCLQHIQAEAHDCQVPKPTISEPFLIEIKADKLKDRL